MKTADDLFKEIIDNNILNSIEISRNNTDIIDEFIRRLGSDNFEQEVEIIGILIKYTYKIKYKDKNYIATWYINNFTIKSDDNNAK